MNLDHMIAIHQGIILENTTIVAEISSIGTQPIFFTYPKLLFTIHLPTKEVVQLSLEYNKSFANLREEIVVGD